MLSSIESILSHQKFIFKSPLFHLINCHHASFSFPSSIPVPPCCPSWTLPTKTTQNPIIFTQNLPSALFFLVPRSIASLLLENYHCWSRLDILYRCHRVSFHLLALFLQLSWFFQSLVKLNAIFHSIFLGIWLFYTIHHSHCLPLASRWLRHHHNPAINSLSFFLLSSSLFHPPIFIFHLLNFF